MQSDGKLTTFLGSASFRLFAFFVGCGSSSIQSFISCRVFLSHCFCDLMRIAEDFFLSENERRRFGRGSQEDRTQVSAFLLHIAVSSTVIRTVSAMPISLRRCLFLVLINFALLGSCSSSCPFVLLSCPSWSIRLTLVQLISMSCSVILQYGCQKLLGSSLPLRQVQCQASKWIIIFRTA